MPVFFIKIPHSPITIAEIKNTQTGIRPVASPCAMFETSQKTYPTKAEIIPINIEAAKMSDHLSSFFFILSIPLLIFLTKNIGIIKLGKIPIVITKKIVTKIVGSVIVSDKGKDAALAVAVAAGNS